MIWFVYYSCYHYNQQHSQHFLWLLSARPVATTEPAPSPHLLRSLAVVLTQAANDDTGHLVWNNKSPAYKSITAVYINTAPLRATLIAKAQRANYWDDGASNTVT